MLPVSNDYLTAINTNRAIQNRIVGTITTTNFGSVTVDDSVLIPGSLSIQKQATDKSAFNIGSVYIGVLKLSLKLKNANITDNDLLGCQIVLDYKYKLTTNTEETIPLGTFYIKEVKSSSGIFALTCYDLLAFFDARMDMEYSGVVYDTLNQMRDYVSFTIGNTLQEIEAFPNGGEVLTIYPEKFETFRDLLSQIASLMTCFVYVSPSDNKIYFKQFKNQTSVRSLTSRHIVKSTILTTNTKIKEVTANFDKDGSYLLQGATNTNTDGAILNLGNLDIIQGNTEDENEAILQNIADELEDLDYTACNFDIIPLPELELGDYITLTTQSGAVVNTILQNIYFVYHKKSSIYSYGLDISKAQVKSAVNRAISTLQEKEEWQSVNVFVSSYDDKTIGTSESNEFFLNLTIKKNTEIFLNFRCNVDNDTGAEQTLTVKCYVNTEEMPLVLTFPIYDGLFSYSHGFNVPLQFLTDEHNDGENYNIILSLQATDTLTVKPYSQLSAIGANIRAEVKTPSSPEDFGFQLAWLNYESGLYAEDGTLQASLAQIMTQEPNFFTNRASSTKGQYTEVLNTWPLGKILIIGTDAQFVSGRMPFYWISDNTSLRVLVFKQGVTAQFRNTNLLNGNTSIEYVFLPSTVTAQYANNTNPLLTGKTTPAVILTDKPWADSTLQTAWNKWAVCVGSANISSQNINPYAANSGAIVWNVNNSADWSYEVGAEGIAGAGLRFNVSDLNLPAGLYDSYNRLIATWEKLEELGILMDEYDQSHDYLSGTGIDASNINQSFSFQLCKLYNKGRKIIYPATFTKIGMRAFVGITTNLAVQIFLGAVDLGQLAYYYNDDVQIYLPDGSTANTGSTNGPWKNAGSNIKIYTNAADKTTFANAIKVNGGESSLTEDNIYLI